jgi:hypothetical protein
VLVWENDAFEDVSAVFLGSDQREVRAHEAVAAFCLVTLENTAPWRARGRSFCRAWRRRPGARVCSSLADRSPAKPVTHCCTFPASPARFLAAS